jgi:mRNA interferase RelE/StbE
LSYKLLIERSAQKDLAKIPDSDQHRIISAIEMLSQEPRPQGCKKLSGREAWRIRVGNYRVIYEIDDKKSEILVVVIGHRRDVYRF